ncbi:MAG TPA: isoprenoid biosynthesis protein ElbB [Candidatus Marinimicrobia bacterium]|nr:MAG: isoprenoid biosynthesis protein ElbB [Candidatus Marinimicrobia bacterium CG1_02_48_14]HCW77136.1 isoprenoid biosynthesis protein ElbB [Candidatus Neomarinimicrobiota bacterium]
MRKKVGVILSGCGVYDGAEIAESVITLLTLDRAGVAYECLAPDIDQMHVINHLTGEVEAGETRNVLVEAARIARGKVKNLALANGDDYDALFFPGGFGAAKNLCDFAVKGADCTVHPEVERLCREVASAKKPIGFICIAPAMIPKIFGPGSKVTIGNEIDSAHQINAMGGVHINCPVQDIVVDEKLKVVSTPAYMLAGRISEAAEGIEKLVREVMRMTA